MTLWVTFSTPPSGDIDIEVTADYALKRDTGLFRAETMIRTPTAPSSVLADLNFAAGAASNVFGSSGTTL